MSATQIARYVKICEDQGITVTRTKKGLMLRFPDGSSTVQHFTTSDVNAVKNQIARFRRAGMTHPDDPRGPLGLPSYITSGTVTEKTKEKILDYMRDEGYPEAVTSSSVAKKLKIDAGLVNRALYHSGFRPGPPKNRKQGRPWYAPVEILSLKAQPDDETATEVAEVAQPDEPVVLDSPLNESPEEVAEAEHEAAIETEAPVLLATEGVPQDVIDEIREQGFEVIDAPTPDVSRETEEGPAAEHVDFIDDRDSWMVDMEALLGEPLYRMVRDRLEVLAVVGIEYEIRVWRTDK